MEMFRKIGEYEILEKIGEGGMSTVYKGIQTSLERPVAVKVLSGKLTRDPALVERFNQEAIIIARLTHPNIIHVIDRGVIEGRHYFVMDYIDGVDFSNIIKTGEYSPKEKVDVIVQVCKGLSYAHKNGVVHRDIKPSNILIDREGNALVVDFGIAQLFNKSGGNGNGEGLTVDGAMMGTLAYMSPEQKMDARKVTVTTDIYSLGVVMYEMFTGLKPLGRFKLPTEINPRFPKPVEQVMLKCLEPEPADRYQSVDALRDSILKLLQGAHIKKSQKERAFQGISGFEEKFSLLDIIKETDYSTVYLFEDRVSRLLMVIKKIKNRRGGLTESRILGKLEHENIVRIFGVSGDEKLFIIVSEYINGGSLRERLVKEYKWREAMRIGLRICVAISFAHKNRVLHGNLRPSNILFTSDGEIKLADFGLEEHYSTDNYETNWYLDKQDDPPCERSDIFSVGVILYEMITGSIPLWRNGRLVPHDRLNKVPARVLAVLFKMIEKKPEKRYQNADAAVHAIEALFKARRRKRKIKRRPVNRRALLLLAMLAALGFLHLYVTGHLGFYMSLFKNLQSGSTSGFWSAIPW